MIRLFAGLRGVKLCFLFSFELIPVTHRHGCHDRKVPDAYGERFFSATARKTASNGSTSEWKNLLRSSRSLFREGKAAISPELAGIFERLGTTAETWQARLERPSKGRLLGRFLAASRQRPKDVAKRLGLRRCPT